MEIVHLILGKANPERMNGVNKVVHQLATHQHYAGHSVSVWGITYSPQDIPKKRAYDVKLFQSHKNKLALDYELISAIYNASADVVFHLHGGFIPEYYHAVEHLIKNNLRFVFTSHGSYNQLALRKNYFVKKIYFKLFEKKILSHAAYIHFMGKSEMNSFGSLFPAENKVLIPNGQDTGEIKFRFNPIKAQDDFIFSFCGRLDNHTKGLDIMLKAFAKYKHAMNGRGALWIIGDGPGKNELEKMISDLKISESVKLWGAKFGEEKYNLLANSQVFLHPSRNEGLPMSVLEAASLRKPCIISEETNLGDYVRRYQSGIVLEKNNIDHLSLAMAHCSAHHNLERMGIAAGVMVKEEFNWKKISEQLVSVYAA